MKNRVEIYTNGACSNNQSTQNTGGYGVIILNLKEEPVERSGGYRNTTNNRMELKAVIEALKVVPATFHITVYSRSQYIINGITEWLDKWIKKGKIAKNGDLWMELYEIVKNFSDIDFRYIGGNKYEKAADNLAKIACKIPDLPLD